MPDAVIVDAVRTPSGRRGGGLADVHPADLSASVLRALVERTALDPVHVEDVQWGCVSQAGDQAGNVGRAAVLAAGWPEEVPAVTVTRACASGQQAIEHAAWAVLAGQMDVVVAGGVESSSRVSLGAARQGGDPNGRVPRERYGVDGFDQLRGAERIARRWNLSRAQLDDFALRSHDRALSAARAGLYGPVLAPVDVGGARVTEDECPRTGLDAAGLVGRAPLVPDGVLQRGHAAPLADAAAALLVTSTEAARRFGFTPIARYHSGAVAAASPLDVLTAHIPATEKVLKRSGLAVGDIGAVEISEPFAPAPMAWLAEVGVDPGIVNAWGGSLALGHPLGATGAVLMTTLLARMRRDRVRFGLQVVCGGGGIATATIIELLDPFYC